MATNLISNVSSTPHANLSEVTLAATRQPATERKAPEQVKSSQPPENLPENPSNKFEAKQAVEKIADFVSSWQSELSFSIDDTSGFQIVKIMDIQTKQVIRQFPSEEAVAIARALDKLQGLLIRDKA
jgi:flagellar protein FlaG